MLGTILNEDNPFVQVLYRADLDEKDGTIIYGSVNNELELKYGQIYKPDQSKEEYIYMMQYGPKGLLHQEVGYMWEMYGDRNLFTNSTLPAQLYAKKHPDKFNFDVHEFNIEFAKIKSGIVDETYRPYLSQYLTTLPYLMSNLIHQSYIKTNKISSKEFEKLFPSHNVLQFKPTIIDREILDAIKNPTKNIDILSKKLKFNEENGYYCYNGIPLICSHEIMLAEGKSLKEVLEACANSKYLCKYCGAELVIDLEDSSVDLNALQFRLIYLFIQAFNIPLYETFLLNVLTESVQKSIEKLELEITDNYIEQTDAFVATYMYKLYLSLKKQITFDDVSGLISSCNKVWSRAGWDEQIVKSLMDNDERFYGFNHIYKLLIAFKKSTEEKYKDNYVVKMLLDGMKGEGNVFQKMYLKDKFKLGQLVDLIYLNMNNVTQLVEYPEIVKKSNATPVVNIIRNLSLNSGLSLKGFFNLWWQHICPVGIVHDFNKGTCKSCGINKDNIDEIYNKYYDKLVEIIQPKIKIELPTKTSHRKKIITDINSASNKAPGIKHIEELMDDKLVNKLRTKLEELLQIGHLDEIQINKETNIKILNYIISKSSLPSDILMAELSSLIIKPNSQYGKVISVL